MSIVHDHHINLRLASKGHMLVFDQDGPRYAGLHLRKDCFLRPVLRIDGEQKRHG